MFLKNKKDISLLSLKITNKEELKKFLTPTVLRKREIQANYNCKELIVYKKSSKDKRFERKQLRLKKKLEKKIERDNKKKIVALKAHWINIMANKGLYNSEKFTYSLGNIKVTYFGYICDVRIPDGLDFEKLNSSITTIEDNLGCTIVANKPKRSNVAHLELIYTTPHDKKFEPLNQEGTKLPPYQLFCGNRYDSEPVIADMVKWPHVLITGGTRSGKSKLTDVILTNLINTCSIDELELYLIQVAKSDLIIYEDSEFCKGFADNLDKTEFMLNYLVDNVMAVRDRKIRPLRKRADGDNYHDYNKINEDKISTTYVVFDEMSSLFQTQGCSPTEKSQKIRIIQKIRSIAQYGAALGVFLIMSLQRPTKDNLDPFLKSQSSFIISFRQNNERSSDVALDDPKMALALEQREFIYHTNKYSYGLVPLITAKKVKKEIEYSFVPGHPTILDNLENDFIDDEQDDNVTEEDLTLEDFMGINNIADAINNETDDINLNMEPTREEILARNIADIPNFVPYEELNENIIVRDETRPRNNNSGRRGRPRRNSNNTINSNEEDVIRVSDNIFDD